MALNFQRLSPTNWKPGQSGNPNGRPREDKLAVEMAKKFAPDAVKALVVALNFKGERVAAAKEILDRAYGKPKQVIEGSPDGSPLALHLLAAQLMSQQLMAEMQSRGQTIVDTVAEPQTADLLDAPPPTE
jgi:hypothetical protein